MEAFGDQFCFNSNQMIEQKIDFNSNDDKEVNEDLKQVNQLLNEMTLKCVQLLANDVKNDENQDMDQIRVQDKGNHSDEDIDENKVFNECDLNRNANDLEVIETNKEVVNNKDNREIRSKTAVKTFEKWGESVGVYHQNGCQKRVLELNEIQNYVKLKLNSVKSDFNYYCSLINDRYPRFYDSTVEYFQRWRMRFNVFVDKVFSSPNSESLLHIGEIHLYFDIIPRFTQPFYVNNSFYRNSLPIEISVDKECIDKISLTLDSIRHSKDILQLKFPIREDLFNNCDKVFDKFMERQTEFVEEAQIVHRKTEQRRKMALRGRFRGEQMNDRFRNVAKNDRNDRELGANNRNDRDFGRNDRDFGRNEREFGKNYREFGRNERGIGRNNRGFNKNRRGFDRNDVEFDENNRGFGRTNRSVREKSVDKGLDSEVTFEDTRERHESIANSGLSNRNKGFNRFNHNKGSVDRKGFKSVPNSVFNERDDGLNPQFDESRHRNEDSLRGKDMERQRFSAPFRNNDRNDSNYNRGKQSGVEIGSEANTHPNFGYNYRPNNRKSAFEN